MTEQSFPENKKNHGFTMPSLTPVALEKYSHLEEHCNINLAQNNPSNHTPSGSKVAAFLNRFENSIESPTLPENNFSNGPNHHIGQRYNSWNLSQKNSFEGLHATQPLSGNNIWSGPFQPENSQPFSRGDINSDWNSISRPDSRSYNNNNPHFKPRFDMFQEASPRTPSPVSVPDIPRRISKSSLLSNRDDFPEESSETFRNPIYRHNSSSHHDLWSRDSNFLDTPTEDGSKPTFPAFRNRLSPPSRPSSTPPFQLQTGSNRNPFGTPYREAAYDEIFSSLTGLSLEEDRSAHEESHLNYQARNQGPGSAFFPSRQRNTLRNTCSVSDLNQNWENQEHYHLGVPTLGRSASFLGPGLDSAGFSTDRSPRALGVTKRESFYGDSSPQRVLSPSLKHNMSHFASPRMHSNDHPFRNGNASPGFVNPKYGQHQLAQAREQLLRQNEMINQRNTLGIADPYNSLEPEGLADPQIQLRSKILEDFRNNRVPRLELKDILGHVVEFSGDQHGSRFIQQKLEIATSEEKQLIFDELLPNALQLMTDVFGNYVIQKFFEHGNQIQKTVLAKQMENHVFSLSLQMYGCRVVQKAIEHVLVDQQAKLIRELSHSVVKCVKDQNGNHVVQKAIERIPAKDIQFILDAFQGQVISLATHSYGCRVIQRMFEHCAESQTRQLLDEILHFSPTLVLDQYGNYVIQHVMERGRPSDRNLIVSKIIGQVYPLSKHKFASNVVEKCVAHGTAKERQILIAEILIPLEEGTLPLINMATDQYANYVVQKMLDVSDDNHREQIISKLKPHLNSLRKFVYGKHLINKVDRIISQSKQRHPNSIEGDKSAAEVEPELADASLSVGNSTFSKTASVASANQ